MSTEPVVDWARLERIEGDWTYAHQLSAYDVPWMIEEIKRLGNRTARDAEIRHAQNRFISAARRLGARIAARLPPESP
jgi:hypothetical protein